VDRRVEKIMAGISHRYAVDDRIVYKQNMGSYKRYQAKWELCKHVPRGWLAKNEERIFSPEAYEGYPEGFSHTLSSAWKGVALSYNGDEPCTEEELQKAIEVFKNKWPDIIDENLVKKYGNMKDLYFRTINLESKNMNKEFLNIYKMKESEDPWDLKLAYGIAQMAIEDIKFLYDEDPNTLESHGYNLDEMEEAMALFARLSSKLPSAGDEIL
jgi:hypothetical protein